MGMVKRLFSRKRGGAVYKINSINIPVTSELDKSHIAKKLNIKEKDIKDYIILKKAIDARKKNDVRFVYSVAVDTERKINGLEEYTKIEYIFPKGKKLDLQQKMKEYIATVKADGSLEALEEKWFGAKEPTEFVSYDDLNGANGTITVAINSASMPFIYLKKNQFVGFDIEFIERKE